MTLRQVLDVLWQRAWIIVLVTVIAVVSAGAYLAVRDVTYETTGTVRLNPVVTEASLSGEIGGVAIDLDPETITAPVILDKATELLNEPRGSLSDQIDVELDETSRTGRLFITGTGPSPESARDRTDAVIEAYRTYVDEQMVAAEATLRERHAAAVQQAAALQEEVRRNPANAIATTNLATALGQMSTLQAQLDAMATSGPATTVLDDAPLGTATVPDPALVIALALLSGLIVGIGAALIRDQFDNRLRGADEIEEISGATSLGELRWDPAVKKMNPPLPVAGSHRTDLSEGLRSVRSTLQVLLPPRNAVIVVTSVEPGDGKSFVTANLALAWARAGKQVILVGGDLRRPDLARYYGEAADGEGVSELLARHADGKHITEEAIESLLNFTGYRRLRLLPSGAEPPDPADLLAGEGYPVLVEKLRALADIVIIDSPPAMGLADASLLAAHTDGAVIMASVRRTDRVLLADTVSGLRANGVEVLGVVGNRGRKKLPKTYSAYYMRPTDTRPATPRLTPQSLPIDTEVDDFEIDAGEAADRPPLSRRRPNGAVPVTSSSRGGPNPDPERELETDTE
ncbi:polysaccharide biosynthesis tyrosine autokinase [Microbacterium sp.]|uniref:polysaccharide biosynthesis tyrosine autokinase n=1 Tax=Microbacterium sp. TaxID=51671 RepID=UPI002C19C296|nr:polysaccharide biosynthesis tyrosine autokinase [Microbacterium sp.]HWL78358.1 polysaccharide biosynthesis tyrosine autokinase [Microbacterium sp.]